MEAGSNSVIFFLNLLVVKIDSNKYPICIKLYKLRYNKQNIIILIAIHFYFQKKNQIL